MCLLALGLGTACGGPDFIASGAKPAGAEGGSDVDNTPIILPEPAPTPSGEDGGDSASDGSPRDAVVGAAQVDATMDVAPIAHSMERAADATVEGSPGEAIADVGQVVDANVGPSADANRGPTGNSTMKDATGPDADVEASAEVGCSAGYESCDGGCAELSTDPHNCGECGNDCSRLSNAAAAGLACHAGHCSYQCAPDYADCAASGTGCATFLRSTSNCGACGVSCASPEVCALGDAGGYACTLVCPSATTNCEGACADVTSDPKNCGACGKVCGPGTRCSGSECVCDSMSGCEGCCSSATTCETLASETVASCGSGGGACAACSGVQTCDTTNGKCVCPSGQSSCGGACVDEQTDPANCGACGTVCPISCNSGTCLKVVSLATGGVNSTMCAVLSDGTVRCWGRNHFGEIGNGVATQGTADADQGVSKPRPVLNLTNATAAAVGFGQSCAITSAGGAACWGNNSDGELGNGSTCTPSCPASVDLMAGPVIDLANVSAISASGDPLYGDFTCALVPGGLVYCWGAGGDGQLGNGSTGDYFQLTPAVVSISQATAIATYALGGCALVSGGTVSCWGSAAAGQSGPGAQQLTPTQVPGLAGVTAISAGGSSACALLAAGTLDCWGYDYDGEVGNGQSGLVNVSPTPVVGLAGLKVAAVSVGQVHACALISDGTVWCWGDNSAGELGNGTVSVGANHDILNPVKVAGLNDAIQISAGDIFTCALESSGAVVCWGDNSIAELGNGTTSVNPQPMPGLVQW